MDDFDWKCPLILGSELEYAAAMELIRQLCVEGIPSGDIEAVQHFKAIQVDDSDEDDDDDGDCDAAVDGGEDI